MKILFRDRARFKKLFERKKRRTVFAAVAHVVAKLKELDEHGEDVDEDVALATVQLILKTVCADGKGDKLLKVVGNDLLRCMKLLSLWTEATQPGEAQGSPN